MTGLQRICTRAARFWAADARAWCEHARRWPRSQPFSGEMIAGSRRNRNHWIARLKELRAAHNHNQEGATS